MKIHPTRPSCVAAIFWTIAGLLACRICVGASPEKAAVSLVREKMSERIREVLGTGEKEYASCAVGIGRVLVAVWRSSRAPVLTYVVSLHGKTMSAGQPLGREARSAHSVRFLPLDDEKCAVAWITWQPHEIGFAVLSGDGSLLGRGQIQAKAERFVMARAGSERGCLLFSERGKVFASLVKLGSHNGGPRLEYPVLLSANGILHTSLHVQRLGSVMACLWCERVVENGRENYGECAPTLGLFRMDEERGFILGVTKKLGRIPLPSWGPPRGRFSVGIVSDDETKRIKVKWTSVGLEREEGKDLLDILVSPKDLGAAEEMLGILQ